MLWRKHNGVILIELAYVCGYIVFKIISIKIYNIIMI